MNRKLTASVLCCVMLALAACGGKSDKEAENAAENATAAAEETAEVETYTPAVHEEGKYYVGIIQQAGHEALNDASRGFQDELNELMGDEVVIDCQVADGTEMGCDIIVDHFLQDQDDLIVAEGHAGTQTGLCRDQGPSDRGNGRYGLPHCGRRELCE